VIILFLHFFQGSPIGDLLQIHNFQFSICSNFYTQIFLQQHSKPSLQIASRRSIHPRKNSLTRTARNGRHRRQQPPGARQNSYSCEPVAGLCTATDEPACKSWTRLGSARPASSQPACTPIQLSRINKHREMHTRFPYGKRGQIVTFPDY
jgi:hypothetical protein